MQNLDDADKIDELYEHEFSAEYRSGRDNIIAGLEDMEKYEKSDEARRRYGRMNHFIKVAALLLCGVILVPVSIHAAVSVYRITVEKNGNYASGTIELNDDMATGTDGQKSTESIEEMQSRIEESEANGTQSVMKGSDGNSYVINSGRRYVEISLGYLPDGVIQVEECKYDAPDRTGYRAISIAATQWDGQSYTVINRSIEDATVRQAGKYEYLLFERGGVDWTFDRVAYVPIKDKSLILTMYIGCDITEEELERVVAGIQVSDAEGDDPSKWVGVDSKFYDDNPANEEQIEFNDEYILKNIGEEFSVGSVTVKVDSIDVYSDTQGINPSDMLYEVGDLTEKKLVNSEGSFVETRCRRMNEASDDGFTSWGEYNNSRLKLVAVNMTYKTQRAERGDECIVIDIRRGKEIKNNGLIYADTTNCYCGDGELRAEFWRQMTGLFPAYITDNGEAWTEKSVDGFYYMKRDGTSHSLAVYFLVDESELDECYMRMTPGGVGGENYKYMTVYLGKGE